MFVICICLIQVMLVLTQAREASTNLALDFFKRSLIKPIVRHGRTKREISTTRDVSGLHHSEVQIMMPVDGKEYLLDLRLNENLMSEDHTLQYQKEGKIVNHRPAKEELDMCHYSGRIKGKRNSWVAISTCSGVRGAIFDGQTMQYIEPAQEPEINSPHYLYNHKNLKTDYNYGHQERVIQSNLFNWYHKWRDNHEHIIRNKRHTDKTIYGPYNADKDSRYLELVLVVDHKVFQDNGGNLQTVHSKMILIANIINSLFSPLNICVALVGVVVWNEKDEIQLDANAKNTLVNFLNYRKRTLSTKIPNDNAQLLTGQSFGDLVMGKALTGPMCTYELSGGVSTNHSAVIGVVATTIAHGIGHNFGMDHDYDCDCPDEKCIMNPSVSFPVPIHWSSCSLSSLKMAYDRGMDYCLHNKPKGLFKSPTCGNGFVEQGEQCDCGITTGINPCHTCCNPHTCTLRKNAVCGGGPCCNLTTCHFKHVGEVCRTKNGECDLPEFCSGHSEYCPVNVHKMDTTPCLVGNNEAYCVHGTCRSHTGQCSLLWGLTGESANENCYQLNDRGTKYGNCGYDRTNSTYKPCLSHDVLCGMLQCRHLSDELKFGMEPLSILNSMYIYDQGTIQPCHTAIIDLGINDVDPGLVPDGAKCGHEKMCLNQKCISIESVRVKIGNGRSVCPENCSGHGVCNSEGHCHCEQGFSPPLCIDPGAGGSVDSGPATDLVRISKLLNNV